MTASAAQAAPAAGATPTEATARHIMSIDVEDWFHCMDPEPANWHRYQRRAGDATRTLLDIFDRTGARCTFFVLADVARHEPKLIEQIAAAGHEIASHGSEHRLVYTQSPEDFRRDVADSLDLLEDITGARPVGYRAPYFSITEKSQWALPILADLGIRYDSSVHPVHNHRYGNPHAARLPHETEAGLLEAPISTFPAGRVNVPCAGGVYFRAFPSPVLHRMYRRLAARGESIVFYLHPWEVDPGHPRIAAPLSLRLRHYWALDRTAAKLERLCRQFRFTTMREGLSL